MRLKIRVKFNCSFPKFKMADNIIKTIINLIKHEPEFTLIHGKEVLEIKPISHDKGTAISYFVKLENFNRRPIFIGDDVSDEDGFETVNKNGWSVRVGNMKRLVLNTFYQM